MKRILVISYFPANESGSMYLWTKDKINELVNLGFKVDLITSPIIRQNEFNNYKTFYVFSLNPSTYWSEYNSGKMIIGLFLIPLVYTIGLAHEIIERLVLRRIGHGMWGWVVPSFFTLLILNMTRKYDMILSLGGPTSAHLATVMISNITRIPSVIEFQDPIVGDDIGHNSRSAYFFRILEKYLVFSRSKIVFVTKQAAVECQKRYPNAKNIRHVYTSSFKSNLIRHNFTNKPTVESSIKMSYFGVVYSTRNYDSLFLALEKIREFNDFVFDLTHYGNDPQINIDSSNKYLNFNLRNSLSRDIAMQEALEFDLLVLIQHTDNRSKLTIPYKTWDYLNLHKPILALLNNDELKELLDGLGHYTCDVNNVDSIVDAIIRFIDDYENGNVSIKPNPYDISKQVLELISL